MTSRKVYIDVENYLTVPFHSGIQRVTKEIVTHLLKTNNEQWLFVPVTFCEYCGGWLKHPIERGFLKKNNLRHYQTRRTGLSLLKKLSEQLPSSLRMSIKNRYKRLIHNKDRRHQSILLPHFEPGSIFFDVDSSWHNSLKRSQLLPALHRDGIKICTLHYDIIPILMPDIVHQETIRLFQDHFSAHTAYSSLFVCISQNTRKDLEDYYQQHLEITNRPVITTVTLGDHFRSKDNDTAEFPSVLKGKKYVLAVGTIEPRKNYETLLDAFDVWTAACPDLCLVLIGREGWHANGVASRIRHHALYEKQLFWLSHLNDSQLRKIYQNAFIYVTTSVYEGFGLPVVEALSQGCVTISSNTGALPEAGKDYVDYIAPRDSGQLAALVERFILDPEQYLTRQRKIQEREVIGWEDTTRQLLDIFSTHLTDSVPPRRDSNACLSNKSSILFLGTEI